MNFHYIEENEIIFTHIIPGAQPDDFEIMKFSILISKVLPRDRNQSINENVYEKHFKVRFKKISLMNFEKLPLNKKKI